MNTQAVGFSNNLTACFFYIKRPDYSIYHVFLQIIDNTQQTTLWKRL